MGGFNIRRRGLCLSFAARFGALGLGFETNCLNPVPQPREPSASPLCNFPFSDLGRNLNMRACHETTLQGANRNAEAHGKKRPTRKSEPGILKPQPSTLSPKSLILFSKP